ncbi:MAG TPA: hypothetical protein VF572_06015 [Candidatus Saccharimonadales bacterium]|jgi:mannose-6-phosphate isomerase-like protein (cupin superfamily)
MKHTHTEFISTPNIPVLETVHDDDRRTIREAVTQTPDGRKTRVTALAIKGAGSVELGNHYHDNPEYFTIHDGDPLVATASKDTPEDVTVRQYSADSPEDSYVTMDPGTVHTFRFAGKGNMTSTMAGEFDPSDLHPQKLVIPERN